MGTRVNKIKAVTQNICDRFWLFTIAAISLFIIGGIVIAIISAGEVPKGAGELFAATMTGLLLIVQKVIDAQQQRRTVDQLAASNPPGPVEVTNTPGDPLTVKESET